MFRYFCCMEIVLSCRGLVWVAERKDSIVEILVWVVKIIVLDGCCKVWIAKVWVAKVICWIVMEWFWVAQKFKLKFKLANVFGLQRIIASEIWVACNFYTVVRIQIWVLTNDS